MRKVFGRVGRPKEGERGQLRAHEAVFTPHDAGVGAPEDLVELRLRHEGRAAHDQVLLVREHRLQAVPGFARGQKNVAAKGRILQHPRERVEVVHGVAEDEEGGEHRIGVERPEELLSAVPGLEGRTARGVVVLDHHAPGAVREAREEPKLPDPERRVQAPDVVAGLDPILGREVVEVDPKGRLARFGRRRHRALIGFREPAPEGFDDEGRRSEPVRLARRGEGVPVDDFDAECGLALRRRVHVRGDLGQDVDAVDDEPRGDAERGEALREPPADAGVAEVVDDAAEDVGAGGSRGGHGVGEVFGG